MTVTIINLDRSEIYRQYIKRHPLPQFNYTIPNFMAQYRIDMRRYREKFEQYLKTLGRNYIVLENW